MEKAKSKTGRSSDNLGTSKNPHNICTLNENSACASCGIKGKLACKWDISNEAGIPLPETSAIANPALFWSNVSKRPWLESQPAP